MDVFGPVDFLASSRLASIFRGEDPFVGSARLWADSVVACTVTVSVDSGVASTSVAAVGCDSGTVSSPAGTGALMSAVLSSMMETSNAAGVRFCFAPELHNSATLKLNFELAKFPFSLRL
jgi:hypothetical protein